MTAPGLDGAFEGLERSIREGSGNPDHTEQDSDLDNLHRDPRFGRMIALARDLSLEPFRSDDDRSGWRRGVPHFEGVAQRHPDAGRAWFNLGYAQLRTRDGDAGTAAFSRALAPGYRRPTTRYNLACSAARTGDVGGALRWLAQAANAGFEIQSQVWTDGDLDPLRSDARFQTLIAHFERPRTGKDKKPGHG